MLTESFHPRMAEVNASQLVARTWLEKSASAKLGGAHVRILISSIPVDAISDQSVGRDEIRRNSAQHVLAKSHVDETPLLTILHSILLFSHNFRAFAFRYIRVRTISIFHLYTRIIFANNLRRNKKIRKLHFVAARARVK